MRYAVLSDIHANLEAMTAVFADAVPRVDAVLCLGDVVGYGADPGPCVDLLAGRADAVVLGNHEQAVVGGLDLAWFNRAAREAAEWTATRLDADQRAWLAALPLVREIGDATLVHASPLRPEEWDYLVGAEEGFAAFGAFTGRVCFVGHSHLPASWSLGSSGPEYRRGVEEALALEPGRRYIVNVGSVGQPRDRDPRAAYAVWDVDARQVSLRRVSYDVATARAKILAAGLPAVLGERLPAGV